MEKIEYKEIEEYLQTHPSSLVNFQELDRDKSIMLDVKGYEIYTYIKPNEFLEREQVEMYYGEEGVEENYKALCTHPFYRLVIQEPREIHMGAIVSEVQEEPDRYTIHLNECYMNQGFQKLYMEKIEELETTQGPQLWIEE